MAGLKSCPFKAKARARKNADLWRITTRKAQRERALAMRARSRFLASLGMTTKKHEQQHGRSNDKCKYRGQFRCTQDYGFL
jgi:hypothetical protein